MKIADVDYEDEDNASIESICVGNDYEPVIKFKDGSKVVFDWKEICGALCNAYEGISKGH